MLLAALERAAGIPSRVAMGLVYYDGIWGGHAWTEVFADGRWRGLDAAMYSPGAVDAARICFGTSSGEDNLSKLQADGLRIYGNVDVVVTAYLQNGKMKTVPEGAPRHISDARHYTNPWLGFRLTAPQGYRVGGLDAVFPDPTILALTDNSGGRVKVSLGIPGADSTEAMRQELTGLGKAAKQFDISVDGQRTQAAVDAEAKKAALTFVRGTALWTIEAEGSEAGAALRETVRGWKWQ